MPETGGVSAAAVPLERKGEMAEPQSTQDLLELRKLTRRVADILRGELIQNLSTLMPLVRPRTLLGHYVQGAGKDPARGADKVFKDLQNAFDGVASVKPFNLHRELKPPLPLETSALEFEPFEYAHVIKTRSGSKTVAVTSPLKWVVYYTGYPPSKLKEAVEQGDTVVPILEHVLHHVMLHTALTMQKGVTGVFEALRFPVSTERLPGLGSLPITVISGPIPTVRPTDARILESTELSGSDAFEEVVDRGALDNLHDPLKEKLAKAWEARETS
jgi:hypothetical protein